MLSLLKWAVPSWLIYLYLFTALCWTGISNSDFKLFVVYFQTRSILITIEAVFIAPLVKILKLLLNDPYFSLLLWLTLSKEKKLNLTNERLQNKELKSLSTCEAFQELLNSQEETKTKVIAHAFHALQQQTITQAVIKSASGIQTLLSCRSVS